MGLSVGIVGLPNVGKSTLFNALLKKQQALAANYPFATIEPNVGIVPVPDRRLAFLAETIASSQRDQNQESRFKIQELSAKQHHQFKYQMTWPPLKPATVKFVDIAGLVKGASEGEGLGNKFLSHIRECEAVAVVIRAFTDADVVIAGSGEAKSDLEILQTELVLADMQTVGKQVMPKGKVTPEQTKRWQVIEKLKAAFDRGLTGLQLGLEDEELDLVRELGLLTLKPVLYVVNVGEKELQATSNKLQADYARKLEIQEANVVVVSAKVEAELASLSDEDQADYLRELGFEASGLERLIRAGYEKLTLQSFLTAGEIECRAWTIKQGTTAAEASGVIHSDFAKKFIKADVIAWEEFVQLGGWKKAREAGAVRSEGRDYVMQEGEVVEFKIGS